MDYVKSEIEFDQLISDPSKCYLAGYGQDNDDNYGKLKVAQANDVQSKDVFRTTTGFNFFNIEGHIFNYELTGRLLTIDNARVSIAKDLDIILFLTFGIQFRIYQIHWEDWLLCQQPQFKTKYIL